jgi:alpha-N-acetylglucosamine transferase
MTALSSWRSRRPVAVTLSIAILLYLLVATHRGDASRHLVWPSQGRLSETTSHHDIDWSNFAYVQYATNSDYLCNSVMIFETLNRLGTRADKVLMYDSTMVTGDLDSAKSYDAQLLKKARDEYKVHLQPIQVQHKEVVSGKFNPLTPLGYAILSTVSFTNNVSGIADYWADSFTKLLAFNQTEYKRVLHLDSDATIRRLMDELFLLPPCPVAMPRAYWLYPGDPKLASPVILVQPSAVEFDRVSAQINKAGNDDYDMEVVNTLYRDQAMVLPHRPYLILTREFWQDPSDHAKYLGTDKEKWDPVAAFDEVKYIHFSDFPLPKPWHHMSDESREEWQPKCQQYAGIEICKEREIWNGIHEDFKERRKVC